MGLKFADSDQVKPRKLQTEVFDYNGPPHEVLNVTRDVMDFKFLKKSLVSDEELEYDIYIKEWEKDYMIL
jgi:hypothetical protein